MNFSPAAALAFTRSANAASWKTRAKVTTFGVFRLCGLLVRLDVDEAVATATAVFERAFASS